MIASNRRLSGNPLIEASVKVIGRFGVVGGCELDSTVLVSNGTVTHARGEILLTSFGWKSECIRLCHVERERGRGVISVTIHKLPGDVRCHKHDTKVCFDVVQIFRAE